MAIAADLRVFSAFISHPKHQPFRPTSSRSKIQNSGFLTGRSTGLEISSSWPRREAEHLHSLRKWYRCEGVMGDKLSYTSVNQEAEFLINAVNMSFFERLGLAWRILFPTKATKSSSNANVAKQRLKMILFSDRCAVSDEAKQKIVSNIVGALSDFVEIDSQDKVQLSVSTDPDLGTVYSVTVPVRRVKAEYQEYDEEYTGITNIEYKDTGEKSGTVDVKFDFFVPNKQQY